MIPASFDYEVADSAPHALSLLAEYGEDAKLLAGGHSLLPMMKLRLAQPAVLIDIARLSELSGIRAEGSELVIGATTRHADIAGSDVVKAEVPLLAYAAAQVGDPQIRHRGTIGGSLCQADPSEDLSAAFAAARATAVIKTPGGQRTVPVREFHRGPYETVVGRGELLTEIRVPLRPGTGSAYEKVSRRVGDWSIAAAGACLSLAGGTIQEAGLGLTAVGAEHFVAAEAEDYLRGRAADEDTFKEAAKIAAEHCHPAADQRGPEDFKRHLVAELTARALRRAADRAGP